MTERTPKSKVLQVRLEPDVFDRFHAYARDELRTATSEVVRQWVYRALDQVRKRAERSSRGVPESVGYGSTGKPLVGAAALVLAKRRGDRGLKKRRK
jgi:hypothetical protein